MEEVYLAFKTTNLLALILGLTYSHYWRGGCTKENNGDIILTPETGSPYTLLNIPDAREISFSFDQNMRPVLAWMAGSVLHYYWYDPTIADYTTSTFDGHSPFVTLDDKGRLALGRNDILLFYIKESTLCYRLQRERYVTERVLATFTGLRLWIRRCGMNRQYRMQIEVLGSDAKLI